MAAREDEICWTASLYNHLELVFMKDHGTTGSTARHPKDGDSLAVKIVYPKIQLFDHATITPESRC